MKKDEARPLVSISALCSLQCFDTGGWWQEGHPADSGSPGKTAIKQKQQYGQLVTCLLQYVLAYHIFVSKNCVKNYGCELMLNTYCLTQEQQFTAQQKDNEEKAIHQAKEQFRQKLSLMERQLTEQKQQVRNSKTAKLLAVQFWSLFAVYVGLVYQPAILFKT